MAGATRNKFLADKSGTKYSEFRNTKRISTGKIRTEKEVKQPEVKQAAGSTEQAASKTK